MAMLDSWSNELNEAFRGWGTDEATVKRVLTDAQGHMSDLATRYSQIYKDSSLEDELYSEYSGDERREVLHLYYEFTETSPKETGVDDPEWATRLNNAFEHGIFGWATEEEELMKVLRSANQVGQMAELKALYAEKYPKDEPLEDLLYKELSGDELKQALRLYYTGFSKDSSICSTGEATQSSQTCSTDQCDGTLTPGGLEERWACYVESGLTDLQKKIEGGGGPDFGAVEYRYARYDKENWLRRFTDNEKLQGASFTPQTTPYRSVLALYENLYKWESDCATYAEIALWHIWRQFIGREKIFDRKFEGLILRNQHSYKLPMENVMTYPSDDPEISRFNEEWDNAPPGTKVSWKNISNAAADTAWNFEFAVKRSSVGPPEKHTYDAFPLGCKLTEKQVKRALAENDKLFPINFLLTNDGLDLVKATEDSLKVVHTMFIQSFSASKDATAEDRITQETYENLRNDVVDKSFDTKYDFYQALLTAGVPGGFLENFADRCATLVDSGKAERYVKDNIFRNDYSLPKLY